MTEYRRICPVCKGRPVAINYVRNNVTHYRKVCDVCSRKGKKFKPVEGWVKSGYKKKERCEKCGFKAKYIEDQLFVYYLDGNLKNNDWTNLKTICSNCSIELSKNNSPWKPSVLIPDF